MRFFSYLCRKYLRYVSSKAVRRGYSIPTMQGSVETIRPYVDEFIQYLDRIDDELTKQWIHQSYELVLSKLPKKLREKYL